MFSLYGKTVVMMEVVHITVDGMLRGLVVEQELLQYVVPQKGIVL
jgi:hypothetical protein